MTTQSRVNPQYNKLLRWFSVTSLRISVWLDELFVGRDTVDTSVFEITRLSLPLRRLTPEFDGYRIVHISDLHVDSWLSVPRFDKVVDMINALEPDLIAITGDFVSYRNLNVIRALQASLMRLQTRDGIFAVFGNHDYLFAYDDLNLMLRKAGVKHLRAGFHTVRRGEAALHLAGIDDMPNKPAFLDKILRQMPADGAAVMLMHKPDFADMTSQTGRFDLSLSGHTHGGQVVVPGIGPLFLPYGGRKYPSGLYRVGDMWQFTTRGLGTADFPLRINCSPEIAVLTLRSASV